MFENVREDLRAGRKWNTGSLAGELINPCTQAVLVHRFGHWVLHLRVPVLRQLLLAAHIVLDYYVRAFIGITISPRAEIGPGMLIHSSPGILVPPVKAGRGLVLQRGAHINWNCAGIGDDVVLGPGCHIGENVTLGSRVQVGPNAVVTSDVPDDATVAVLPPRVIRMRLRKRVKQEAAPAGAQAKSAPAESTPAESTPAESTPAESAPAGPAQPGARAAAAPVPAPVHHEPV